MGVSGLRLLHLFAQGEVGAIVLFDDVDGDVDGGLSGRVVRRDRQAHGNIEHVLAVNGHAPNQADVLLRRGAEIVPIGRKRHGKQRKSEQDGGNAEVKKHVPTSLLEPFLALFDGHLFHLFLLVLVHSKRARCIKFLFGHITPISAEHFKTAEQESSHHGNR